MQCLKIRSFLWNALDTRMCVHRKSLHQIAPLRSGVIPEEDHRMQKFCLLRETNILYGVVSLALSQHASLSILSLVRLSAMTVSIDLRYKPLIGMYPWVQTKSSSVLALGSKQKHNGIGHKFSQLRLSSPYNTIMIYAHRQKLSNTTFFRRHCFGYAGNGNQIFWILL